MASRPSGVLMSVFNRFDQNNDGKISKKELRHVFQQLNSHVFTEKALDMLLNRMDSNEDGSISYKEFASWVTEGSSSWADTKEAAMSLADETSRLAISATGAYEAGAPARHGYILDPALMGQDRAGFKYGACVRFCKRAGVHGSSPKVTLDIPNVGVVIGGAGDIAFVHLPRQAFRDLGSGLPVLLGPLETPCNVDYLELDPEPEATEMRIAGDARDPYHVRLFPRPSASGASLGSLVVLVGNEHRTIKKGHSWRMHVRQHMASGDHIDEVTFVLHPTFKNPTISVKRQGSLGDSWDGSFLSRWHSGWGIFDVKVALKLRSCEIHQTYHTLSFEPGGSSMWVSFPMSTALAGSDTSIAGPGDESVLNALDIEGWYKALGLNIDAEGKSAEGSDMGYSQSPQRITEIADLRSRTLCSSSLPTDEEEGSAIVACAAGWINGLERGSSLEFRLPCNIEETLLCRSVVPYACWKVRVMSSYHQEDTAGGEDCTYITTSTLSSSGEMLDTVHDCNRHRWSLYGDEEYL